MEEQTQVGDVGRMVDRFIELRSIIDAHQHERSELQEKLTALGVRVMGMARHRNRASAPIRRRRRAAAAAPEANGPAVVEEP